MPLPDTIAEKVSDSLKQQGFVKTIHGEEYPVRFSQVGYVPDKFIALWVDIKHLPPRVAIDKLMSRQTLHSLSTVLGGLEVRVVNTHGLIYVVNLSPELPSKVFLGEPTIQDDYPVPIGRSRTGDVWLPITHMGHTLIGGVTQSGKALTLDTPLPTPTGWVTMGDVRIGDKLFDENGIPCSVVYTSDVMVGHKVYLVTFDDGTSIKADADHLWMTLTRLERIRNKRRSVVFREKRRTNRHATIKNRKRPYKPSTQVRGALLKPVYGFERTTEEIKNTLFAGSYRNHSISLAQPLDLPETSLEIPPYTLGAWLGDGTSDGMGFSCNDEQIISEIKKDGFEVRKWDAPFMYGIQGFGKLIRSLNLIGNKHIPEKYFRASYQQRLSLFQGLMDTDGYVDSGGSSEFYSTIESLALDVSTLMTTLGLKHKIQTKRATLYGKDCGVCFVIHFSTKMEVFRLERKRNRLIKTERGDQKLRYIVSVEPIESEPVKCVQVDSESHLYLAGRGMVPTHNTSMLKTILSVIGNNPLIDTYIIDPKQVGFAKLSHLAKIVSSVEDATTLLHFVHGELERRKKLFSEIKVETFPEWRSLGNADKLIVVVIDEFTSIALSAGLDSEFYTTLKILSSQAASFGIHLFLSTQNPKAEVLNTLIRSNCDTRIAFRVATKRDSNTILDTYGAEKIKQGQKGRFLLRHSGKLTMMQAFLAEEE